MLKVFSIKTTMGSKGISSSSYMRGISRIIYPKFMYIFLLYFCSLPSCISSFKICLSIGMHSSLNLFIRFLVIIIINSNVSISWFVSIETVYESSNSISSSSFDRSYLGKMVVMIFSKNIPEFTPPKIFVKIW